MPPPHSISGLDVVVLAGGLGTRLAPVLGGLPKLLAPVSGRPFLEYLLAWLARQGVRRLTLCLGYRADAVSAWLDQSGDLPLRPSIVVEPEPRGTAGAVAFALPSLKSRPLIVMNGDSFVDVDLRAALEDHLNSSAQLSMVCVRVPDGSRYGAVQIGPDGFVQRFFEKNSRLTGPAWISAGIYIFEQPVLGKIAALSVGSLEHDIFEQLPPCTIRAFMTHGAFLDIGTPESLSQASSVLNPGVFWKVSGRNDL